MPIISGNDKAYTPGLKLGKTIYVDDDNIDGPWDGTHDHPFNKIQDGIDNANDNDIIRVFEGIYDETQLSRNPVNINKNQQVSIQFILSEPSDVQIKIYNILGQEIYSSNLNNLPPNIYIKKWNCRNRNNDYVSSGIYFIKISVKESTEIKKVILVR